MPKPVFDDESKNEVLLELLQWINQFNMSLAWLDDGDYRFESLEAKARWTRVAYDLFERSIVEIHHLTGKLVDEDGDIVGTVETPSNPANRTEQ